MGEQHRKGESFSPKSSPRGARSPLVARQDSSGTLKTTISLGKNPSIVHSGPFYLMKEPPHEGDLTGATNLMSYYGLEHSYTKFSGKRPKEQLSSFLPNLPNPPGCADSNEGTLRSVIERPPVGGKELIALTGAQLAGFRLHPGPLPDRYRCVSATPQKRHRTKHKKHKHKDGATGQSAAGGGGGVGAPHDATNAPDPASRDSQDAHENKQRHKKQKRHDDDKERKKRKKEKKRKKQKHSPDHPAGLPPPLPSNSA